MACMPYYVCFCLFVVYLGGCSLSFEVEYWSQWEDATSCSHPCGVGTKNRVRTCLQSNQSYCDGQTTQIKECFESPCPAVGFWHDWSEWSACQVSCEMGNRTRQRTCATEDPCLGEDIDVEPCNATCSLDTCPQRISSMDCNSEDQCWNLSMSGGNWKVGISTRSVSTGPIVDNTFPSGCGNFAYFEASGVNPNDTSSMTTPYAPPNNEAEQCFRFYVSMYSKYESEMGSLRLYRVDETPSRELLWTQSGVLTQNDTHWVQHSVSIPSTMNQLPFAMEFEAERGLGYNSDMAVDDVVLHNEPCSGPPEEF